MNVRYIRAMEGCLRRNQYLTTKEEVEQCRSALAGAILWAEKQDRENAKYRESLRAKRRVLE
jgi:hypothetical protein